MAKYKKVLVPAWKHTMQLGGSEMSAVDLAFLPQPGKSRGIVVLADPRGRSAFIDETNNPHGLAKLLADRKFQVMVVNFPNAPDSTQKQADLFFTAYNRTFVQERVRDLVNACELARKSGEKVILCGTGRAGLWAMLAAPAADAVVADCDELDISSDAALLKMDLFVPGLRKIGAFEGAANLAAPHPILLHNTGENFSTEPLHDVYSALNSSKLFRGEKNRLGDEELANWIAELK